MITTNPWSPYVVVNTFGRLFEEEQLKSAMNRWSTALEEVRLTPTSFQGRVNEIESELSGIYLLQTSVSKEILMKLESTHEQVGIALYV